MGAGIRAEWFRDNNGFRINGPGRCGASGNTSAGGYGLNNSNGSNTTGNYNSACSVAAMANYPIAGSGYYELTAGLTYKPVKWLNLRPNVRFDYANTPVFAGGTEHTQVLFTADAVVIF